MEFTGKVIKLGDDVNTDVIAPTRWIRATPTEMRLHSCEAVRPDLHRHVLPGDILVVGRNFGCGSHRLSASTVLRSLGFSALVAESIARLYFRNCISIGFPAISLPGVTGLVREGDQVRVVLEEYGVSFANLEDGRKIEGPPLPALAMNLLEEGGFIPLLKRGSPGIRRKAP